MTALRASLVVVSALLLGAHFLRADQLPLMAASLAAPALLAVRHPWAPRILRLLLVLGAAEWLRTTVVLIRERAAAGDAWTRLAVILGLVTLLTAAAAVAVPGRPSRPPPRPPA